MTNYGTRICAIGDSLVLANFIAGGGGHPLSQTTGVATMLEAISLGQFKVTPELTFGVSGDTTGGMVARFDNQVGVNWGNFDILWIDGGRNDGDSTLSDALATITNLKYMANAALAHGKKVFMMLPNPPRTTGISTLLQEKIRSYVNQQMRVYAKTNPGVFFIDYWHDWVNGTSTAGAPSANITYDGIHSDYLGAYNAASRVIATVGSEFPQPPRIQPAWNVFDGTFNISGNAVGVNNPADMMMLGTSGTLNNASGVVANNWTLFGSVADSSRVVGSVVPAVAGIGSVGSQTQKITISTLTAPLGGLLLWDAGAPVANLVNQSIEAVAEVSVSNIVNCTGIVLYAQYYNGSTNEYVIAMNNGSGNVIPYANSSMVLRTPPLPYTNLAQNLQIFLGMAFNTGGSGVITMANPALRIVQ